MAYNLNNIQWLQYTEYHHGASDPSGYPNNFDRANLALFEVMSAYYRDTGYPKLAEALTVEAGSYTGNAAASRTVTLTDTDLEIDMLWVLRGDTGTQPPMIRTASMTGTKELGTAALSSTMITALGTGEFTVDSSNPINQTGVTYYYFAFGRGL